MPTENPELIPIPFRQRWHDARLRFLPVVVFASALCAIAYLWRQHVPVRAIVGQAEPVLSNASCYKSGVLAELNVNRFQRVKAGDPIGKVLVTDPRILASSLALIQAEIDSLQANLKPVVVQQRNAMDYDQLRLNWMKERAQLATSRVNLELAEAEYHRMAELFKDQIVAQRVYEQAKGARDRLQKEVDNLATLVQEGEEGFNKLQITNAAQISQVSADPLHAAIAVQESKLRLTEAELSPVTVRAPIDGLVSTIFHRAGESITAGQPIVAVATLNPVRIIGYVLPPIVDEPKTGMKVEVRTRGLHRQAGLAKILEVGTQLESVPVTLLGPIKFANTELGLPVEVSLPANLNIRAGELVDIVFNPTTESLH
jgi:HlyD family secretion protein